jgi:hypothetical protein
MSLRIGDDAPNFKAQTSNGEIDFYDYLGDSWGVSILASGRLYTGLYYRTGQNRIIKR